MKLLPPQILQAAIDNSATFKKAKKLLWLNWDEDPNMLYHNQVEPDIVEMARILQQTGVIKGRVDLSDYRAVSQMLAQHSYWFSQNGKAALLSPFDQ